MYIPGEMELVCNRIAQILFPRKVHTNWSVLSFLPIPDPSCVQLSAENASIHKERFHWKDFAAEYLLVLRNQTPGPPTRACTYRSNKSCKLTLVEPQYLSAWPTSLHIVPTKILGVGMLLCRFKDRRLGFRRLNVTRAEREKHIQSLNKGRQQWRRGRTGESKKIFGRRDQQNPMVWWLELFPEKCICKCLPAHAAHVWE